MAAVAVGELVQVAEAGHQEERGTGAAVPQREGVLQRQGGAASADAVADGCADTDGDESEDEADGGLAEDLAWPVASEGGDGEPGLHEDGADEDDSALLEE